MNWMLALIPDAYKPDFILSGLVLCQLPADVCSYLFQEKADPRALVLKADELFQSKTSSPVNLLAELLKYSVQLNTVSTFSHPTKAVPLAKRSSTPAPSAHSPTLLASVGIIRMYGDKAVNCQKPCLDSEN